MVSGSAEEEIKGEGEEGKVDDKEDKGIEGEEMVGDVSGFGGGAIVEERFRADTSDISTGGNC